MGLSSARGVPADPCVFARVMPIDDFDAGFVDSERTLTLEIAGASYSISGRFGVFVARVMELRDRKAVDAPAFGHDEIHLFRPFPG
jgi:hypothetical protein